jgi:hypothetical protein
MPVDEAGDGQAKPISHQRSPSSPSQVTTDGVNDYKEWCEHIIGIFVLFY